MNVTVGGGEYMIAWDDAGSDGLVNAGDAFNATLVSGSGPPLGTVLTFELQWSDGTILAAAR